MDIDQALAEIARIRTDLEITRDVLAQTQRALDAERAARGRAETQNGVPAIRQERIDILAGMVQDLRMRLAAAEGENVRLRAEKHELAAHVLRLFGEDERPSLAIRALVLRARAALEGNTQ